MKRLLILFVTLVFSAIVLRAQELPWSFSVSSGLVRMDMGQVETDNTNDIRGWNQQGIPIEEFKSVKTAWLFGAKGSYRFERDIFLSLAVAYAEREVRALYESYDVTLDLKRSVGFTDITAGLGYYFPIFPIHTDAYAGAELGMMFARANALAFSFTQKEADSTQIEIVLDSEGIYRKNKLVLSAIAGANIHVLEPVFVQVEAKYKFGLVGKMEGDVRRFDVTDTQETTIEFDYSGLFLSIGIGIVF